MHALVSGVAFVVKGENILASLYITRKRSRLASVQSSITGLYGVRHSPLLLLTLGITKSKLLFINGVQYRIFSYHDYCNSILRYDIYHDIQIITQLVLVIMY